MQESQHKEEQNFWISYADLMAGLLFVFILVVGAIIVKTVLIQSDLQVMKSDLEKQKAALHMSEKDLFEKKKKLRMLQQQYLASQEENLHLSMQISLLESEVGKLKENISLLNVQIEQSGSKLTLTQEELQSVKELLLAQESENNLLEQNNTKLQTDIDDTKTALAETNRALKGAKLKNELNENIIKIRDDEIAQLEKALLLKKREYQQVVDDLNITKLKIKNLTGIKIKVVRRLKEKLGNSIKIDPKTGAIRFSSNILFNQGEATLKLEAKKELSKILGKYIDTLLNDPNMRRYIDLITIEGHTNSDGSYLYNLNLSQQRALAVMSFLYEQYPKNRKIFRKYLSASGRSFAEPVLRKDKKEDKQASRRIEIKFRIKNENAVKELMNYLNKKR